MARTRAWAAGLLGILLLVILFQNLGSSRLSVLFWSWELPLLVVMLGCVAAGALLGALVVMALSSARKP